MLSVNIYINWNSSPNAYNSSANFLNNNDDRKYILLWAIFKSTTIRSYKGKKIWPAGQARTVFLLYRDFFSTFGGGFIDGIEHLLDHQTVFRR